MASRGYFLVKARGLLTEAASVAEGEGGKIWENGIEPCIISCMKRVASPG